MSKRPTDPLLLAGRVLTLIMQGLMALCSIVLAIILPVLFFFRDSINAELLAEHGTTAAQIPAGTIAGLFIIIIVVTLLAFRFFGFLRRIIETVEKGDPFVPDNADRLTSMAWHLTGIYILMSVAAAVGLALESWVETLDETDVHVAFSFDMSMVLTIVILFILARVFRKGTEMREDLEGTV
ncbi:DUF2975 domain-containing protein [Altererythrobacter sp. GH1-8]|uniref:DUF2975 domain-containing protein n=1 Tax=Altererythrobacter sp. GH1-8 TaxID=3349333 RepID=UPI00374DF299